MPMTEAARTARVKAARAAIGRGDLLSAYDLTRLEGPIGASTDLSYIAVLAMARMGETEQAMTLYESSRLSTAEDVDSQSLWARLLKDHALQNGGGPEGLKRAADAYEGVYNRTSDPFPAINAATLNLLAGDPERARFFARIALAAPSVAAPLDYYGGATRAEALTILDREEEAVEAIELALALPGADVGARSTTLRQFDLLAGLGSDEHKVSALIRRLSPPSVVNFTGHIFRHDPVRESELAALIDARLEESNVGLGYGALAAGADILIAERILARGSTVHLVFPFREDDFIASSVLPAGRGWLSRYDAVREQASGVSFATLADFVNDPAQFGYGSSVAMGMARLRARHLGAPAIQLALWDEKPSSYPAGTAHDVNYWRATGGTTFIIPAGELDRSMVYEDSDVTGPDRHLKALLFADFPGFTRISEGKMPHFWSRVMTIAGSVLAGYEGALDFANSWGDAVFAVFGSAEAAADAGLALQAALIDVSPAELGLDSPTQMRVSLHYGPVYAGRDPISGRDSYYGTEISRAARVEPLTPPGSVYASEPLAAVLANTAADKFRATYVGKIDLPKGFGQYPLYALRRSLAVTV